MIVCGQTLIQYNYATTRFPTADPFRNRHAECNTPHLYIHACQPCPTKTSSPAGCGQGVSFHVIILWLCEVNQFVQFDQFVTTMIWL